MKKTNLFLISQVFLLLGGCSGLMNNRSFIDQMDRDSGSMWSPGEHFEVTSGDSGRAHRSRDEVLDRTPASGLSREQSLERQSVRNELSRKLSRLTDEQYTQYVAVRDHLDSTTEKIYYLDLPANEREDYVRTKVFSVYKERSRSPASQSFGYHSIRNPKITVGMRKSDIIQTWGRPAQVDVAGNPSYENERWSFQVGGQTKQIYFEGGAVSGWILE